jgi:hypothetical protein
MRARDRITRQESKATRERLTESDEREESQSMPTSEMDHVYSEAARLAFDRFAAPDTHITGNFNE